MANALDNNKSAVKRPRLQGVFVLGFGVFAGYRIALGILAILSAVSSPALASAGCSAFRGGVDNQTRGEGGNRVGAGFSKGDRLAVTIRQAPGQFKDRMKQTAGLLEYALPDGPFRGLTEDKSESFAYTVPANTGDFIYLNLGGVLPSTIVTWNCTPARQGR